MNGFSVAGFQNQNMNQMDSENLVAGNWSSMYTQNQPDLRTMNQKKSNGKITVVFKTGRGIITTIFMPLTITCAWYGMNFENMPEFDWPYSYLGFVIFNVLLVLLGVWFLKREKIM